MSNSDGRYWMVFNGEIYNFQELQNELIAAGHSFATRSDTEVVVHAYEEWGEKCVSKFRGMFAMCILDTHKRTLFLARDHIGIKPLYYTNHDNFFAFASELQAFKAISNFKPDLNLSALDKYLWLQYIPAPDTIFEGVHKLSPGHSFTFDLASGKASEQKRFWDAPFHPDPKMKLDDAVDELEKVVKDSVKSHLVADVPFGAFLSGGLDSTLVVHYMAQELKQPVKTFSIGFEEEEYNELPFAELVAKKLNTEHHVEIVQPDALKILPELVKHYGEPFGDSSSIPTYYVSQMARKHVKMVLSGDGGDEAFGGYKTYTDYLKWELPESSGIKQQAKQLLGKVMPGKYPPVATIDKWINYVAQIKNDWRVQLWKPEFQHVINTKLEVFEEHYRKTTAFALTHKWQYIDLHTYLPNDILTKVDVASMCHSLEVRTPLVDWKVWEFANTLPPNFGIKKINGGYSGKFVMKKLMERYYPQDFVNRTKMGFSIPAPLWFAGSDLGRVMEEKLTSADARISKYFTEHGIKTVMKSGNYRVIWMLLFLEYWLDDYYEA
jgi:asparagine synthase (glutamine-hydrolysing)